MDDKNYVVRRAANDESGSWSVELGGQVVCRVSDRTDAIAAASAAARDTASREATMCRVSLVTEAGDCVPLTVFGSRLDHQRMVKKLARRWAA